MAAVADGRGEEAGLRGAAVNDGVECRCHGRDLTVAGMGLPRGPAVTEPARAAIARAFRRRIGRLKPDGGPGA